MTDFQIYFAIFMLLGGFGLLCYGLITTLRK